MNPSRRSFIQKLGAASLAVAAGRAGAQQSTRKLRKGYMMGTFPDKKLPLLERFRMLKETGFDGVEPAISEDPEEVLRARDATGLQIASMSCGGASRMFASALPPARAKAVDELKAGLRNAKRYGIRSILVVPGVVDEKTTYRQNWDRCTECIKACVPVAEEAGVKMAVENVWNNFLQSPMECVQFIDQFGTDKVAMHFDIGNMMSLGWPEQWIEIIGRRIACIHIKEFSRTKMMEEGKRKGFEVEYLEGDNDWPAIMQALRGIDYDGWAIVEPAFRPKDIEIRARLGEISKRLDKILAS
ncbi:MAG: sugar phosphate isomerase/epimerase [Verrucomicrobiaceae bacterium]|nr:sugar phosphate isomerase/epimerase [Verrucomicrobiaceae bacterium]